MRYYNTTKYITIRFSLSRREDKKNNFISHAIKKSKIHSICVMPKLSSLTTAAFSMSERESIF